MAGNSQPKDYATSFSDGSGRSETDRRGLSEASAGHRDGSVSSVSARVAFTTDPASPSHNAVAVVSSGFGNR